MLQNFTYLLCESLIRTARSSIQPSCLTKRLQELLYFIDHMAQMVGQLAWHLVHVSGSSLVLDLHQNERLSELLGKWVRIA